MKLIFFIKIICCIFFTACSIGTSSKIYDTSLPNFKEQYKINENIQKNDLISINDLEIIKNYDYSNEFEHSVLKIRIDESIKLLKTNLQKQIMNILKIKNYKINENNKIKITINLNEKEVKKHSKLFSGDYISSKLNLNIDGDIIFIDKNNIEIKIKEKESLTKPLDIKYDIKNNSGSFYFKSTISATPTRINEDLQMVVLEIDQLFLSFYRDILNTIYTKIPNN